jgi:hypothetical protein
MSIQIKEAVSPKEIKEFVLFQYGLYKDNPYFVPPLIHDEIETFDKSKNPAYEVSDAKFFLAYRDGKIVGRIVAINNKPANKKYGTKNLRFSWVEFIEDFEVLKALLDKCAEWGKELGMETMTGPHGFCDFDPQGLLVEGYDKLATIASFYNHPYYKELFDKYGAQKEIDYMEFWSTTPFKEGIPQKMIDTCEWIKKRNNFKLIEYPKLKDYVNRGEEIFTLLEKSFENNFGTVPLTEHQMTYYIKKYLSFLNKKLIKLVENEKGELVGFLISMPNLSIAMQKSKGKLFPLGWYHTLKALKTYDVLDFYFAGVREDCRNKGVDAIMALEIVKTAMEFGFAHAESNQELETNSKVQAQWKFFNPVNHKRRRIFKINI